jgi:hypothetical protein
VANFSGNFSFLGAPCTKPLPLFRSEIKRLSFGYVKQHGYVHYLNHFFFAGLKDAGSGILVVNYMTQHIYLHKDDENDKNR